MVQILGGIEEGMESVMIQSLQNSEQQFIASMESMVGRLNPPPQIILKP